MNKIKNFTLAGMTGTALLGAIVLTVPLPQFLLGIVLLLLGLVLTALGAAYLKNLDTLNIQGRILSALAELHTLSNAEQAAHQVEKILARLFPRAQIYKYPPRGDDFEPVMGWDQPRRLVQQSLEQGRALLVNSQEGGTVLPDDVQNMAAIPLGSGSYEALLLVNLPLQSGMRNLQLTLDTLYTHLALVLARIDSSQQEQERFEDLLGAVVEAIASHDPLFMGHAQRVADTSRRIGRSLGMSGVELQLLVWAAWLHDIGRTMPTRDEQTETDHASAGAQFIPETASLAVVKSAVRHHHERYDGSGYPLGLKHTAIPLEARIIAVADIYDALTTMGQEEDLYEPREALGVIKKAIGTQFDPLVVVAFEEAIELESGGI